MNEILRNFPASKEYRNSSFVGIWHEQCKISIEEYWKLDKAIYDLSEIYVQNDIPREVAWPLMRIFSYIMASTQAHYDLNDGFQIKDLEDVSLNEFTERFQLVFEGFFKGDMPKNSMFSIINPLIEGNNT